MSREHVSQDKAKFTRGEKCLFTHVVITFVLFMILVIIYYVHLLVVEHDPGDMFRVTRRSSHTLGIDDPKFKSVGVLYLDVAPVILICNTLLLRSRWSLLPGQCASMRSDPDMSEYLLTWTIRYRINGRVTETGVDQNFVHSHFDADDFSNNIGLLKHIDLIHGPDYSVPLNVNVTYEIGSEEDTILAGWVQTRSASGAHLEMLRTNMKMVAPADRNTYVSMVKKLKSYETCIWYRSKQSTSKSYIRNRGSGRVRSGINLGAMFYVNNQIVGFFSWGDKEGKGVPLVILNITHFRNWYEGLISL